MYSLSIAWRLILLACLGVLTGCATTPPLVGATDATGLVVVETDITSGSLGITRSVSGRVKIVSLANPQVEVIGKPYKDTNYHVFSGLTPGVYRLDAVAYGIGNTSTTLTFSNGINIRGTFEVKSGDPWYVGKLKIAQRVEGLIPKMNRSIALEFSPADEKSAWETLAAEPGYANSPWLAKIRQRLEK